MKILLACDYDNGGQMIALAKALNKYTCHKARLITFRRTYLGYEEDVFNPPPDEVESFCAWADFFILGEVLTKNIQSASIYTKINPSNCIIRAGGTIARTYPQAYMTGGLEKIMKTGAYHDPTIASRVFPMAATVNMYHFDEWPVEKKEYEAPFKLVFSGTAQKQQAGHSGAIMAAWDELGHKYGSDKIEFVNIRERSWAESLAIKSQCHICYDQLSIGAYANSAIEGMFYHMPTFCYVSGWCGTVHPDAPLISVKSAEDIVEITESFIEDPDRMYELGKEGHDYVVRVHDAKNAVERWEQLIHFVSKEYLK
ncbi:MAG: hypothetical protein PHH85_02020 [Candidatus Methanoperedens sp.]|nr:hypothetical protein [Candidatus Methanoperedens sp.]